MIEWITPSFAWSVGKDLIKGIGFWRKRRKLTPEQKISARDKWRPIFEDFFAVQARDRRRGGDVIIHDVARLDVYPQSDNSRGISAWFRVGLMGTYHRGILLGLRWTHVVNQPDGTWRENYLSSDGTKVMLLGEVPYEAIESVNWDGDPYYNKPHIFLHFDYKRQPYERLFFGEQRRLEEYLPFFYTDIVQYQKAQPRWLLVWWKVKGWLR